MKIQIYLLIIISSIISFNLYAQEEGDTLTAKEYRLLKKEMAISQIKELKNGALIVQLKTSQNTIDAYAKKGNLKKSLKVKMNQDADNKSIIKGFRDHFTFCPVYFIYTSSSKNLKNKEFDKVVFIDDSLNTIPAPIDLTKTNYYISGITKNNYNNTTLNNLPYYKSDIDNSIQFDAFIIKNKDFQQLSSPFPYYAKTHQAVKMKDNKRWETIKKLNLRLHNFHQ